AASEKEKKYGTETRTLGLRDSEMTFSEHSRFGDQEIKDAKPTSRELTALEHPAFERHYRIGELADMWKLGRETVRLLVKDDRGLIKIRRGRKKRNPVFSVPQTVPLKIHASLLSSR